MLRLSSVDQEIKLISMFFHRPYHLKAISIDVNCFTKQAHRDLMFLIKKYVTKYKNPPTRSTLVDFSKEFANTGEDIAKFTDALLVIDSFGDTNTEEFSFYFDKVANYKIGRDIFDIAEFIKSEFEKDINTDFRNMRKNILSKLLTVRDPDDKVVRGFLHDSAKDRWDRYKERDGGNLGTDIIPFCIKSLDDVLGGMFRSFLTLIYSKSGGGKTRTAINIAYNCSLAGYNVVYFSLEMRYDLLAACFDSRQAWINSNHIIFGKLETQDKKKYFESLKKMYREKTNIWIVDIPKGATTGKLYEEISLYKAATGRDPDLVIIDYANLMEPMKRYQGRSEKYDALFQEFHEFVRDGGFAGITATQESRTATQNDKKKKKDEDVDGLENIGLSNYMANHCENVIRLKHNKFDRLQNRMNAVIDKSRYASPNTVIPLFALFDKNYVGDSLVPGTGVTVRKENSSVDF